MQCDAGLRCDLYRHHLSGFNVQQMYNTLNCAWAAMLIINRQPQCCDGTEYWRVGSHAVEVLCTVLVPATAAMTALRAEQEIEY